MSDYRDYQRRTSKFISWFPKILILSLGLAVVSSQANATGYDRTAKLYAIGKTNEAPLFTQKTHFEEKDGVMFSETNIVDPKGNLVVNETASYKGSVLILQKLDQFQTKRHFEIEVKNERVNFKQGTLPYKLGDKVIEDSVGYFDNFITGPTSEAFIGQHWDEILAGKIVVFRFGVMEIKDTVKFQFKMIGKQKLGDQDVIAITMKPGSMFISMLVDPITIYMDPKDKRYLKFVGRTPLKFTLKNDLKSLDAELVYDPDPVVAPTPNPTSTQVKH